MRQVPLSLKGRYLEILRAVYVVNCVHVLNGAPDILERVSFPPHTK